MTDELSHFKEAFLLDLYDPINSNITKFYVVANIFRRALINNQSHISNSFGLAIMLKKCLSGSLPAQAQDESNELLLLPFQNWYIIFKCMSILNTLSYNNEIALK